MHSTEINRETNHERSCSRVEELSGSRETATERIKSLNIKPVHTTYDISSYPQQGSGVFRGWLVKCFSNASLGTSKTLSHSPLILLKKHVCTCAIALFRYFVSGCVLDYKYGRWKLQLIFTSNMQVGCSGMLIFNSHSGLFICIKIYKNWIYMKKNLLITISNFKDHWSRNENDLMLLKLWKLPQQELTPMLTFWCVKWHHQNRTHRLIYPFSGQTLSWV